MAHTLTTDDSKGVVIAASRGRNPQNPSDRTVRAPTEQRLEINKNGTSNTITTVQKDNYVLEGVDVHPFSKKLEFGGYRQKEVSPCLLATDYKAPKTILESQPSIHDHSIIGTKEEFKTAVLPVVEPNVLTPKRTEYGKAIRKDYENGLIKESRHNMTEMHPRKDGISNTLTTVQKDNLVVEQVRRLAETARPNVEIGITLKPNGDIRPHRMDIKKSGIQELNINHEDNQSHTVTSANMPKEYGYITDLRIRKLTPKECWRLMGCSDEDFHKAEQVNSNTQLYKQAGNAIVVDVLEAIFNQLFLKSGIDDNI